MFSARFSLPLQGYCKGITKIGNNVMKSCESVLVGMSGGIDSTAVCRMLQDDGYRVVGLTFITCDASQASASAAAALASRLGIEHHIVDVRDEFRRTVVQRFLDSYLEGLTPNPCVECNPTVKFRILVDWARRLGCSRIATGHYANVVEKNSKYYISAGVDTRKDQSYFLWRLTQEQLSMVLFPLGRLKKDDVRKYLGDSGFVKESQGGESMEVCFIPGDYRDFLRSNIPDSDNRIREGSFVDSEGHVLGSHKGYPYYTIGQRKGLGIALGYPAYVLKINPKKNTVMLGREEDLRTSYMLVDEPQWVDGVPQSPLTVRVRYRSSPLPCTPPQPTDDGRWLVRLLVEASSVTPGQSAVFYVGDTVVGGAFISSQRGINQWITV